MAFSETDNLVDFNTAKQLGLNEEEFNKICELQGRTPNFTELSIFSVMWSEHCSYKNSIQWLKTLPRDGAKLLVSAGEENAGLVDIGNGFGCAFKIESHNHPSAIEPYQGAATGVGGIHRDIFTMGARPIAALNSLRFGNIDSAKTRHIIEGVVKGIGDYGNSFGVPTVGGEVYFDDCYQTNPLVNAMSVGIVKADETVSATSYGAGNPVFIVGAATGKDGIHGATFASAELTEDSADDLPAVQVGDPFQEKLLLEASLEVIQTGALIGMQDMGAAGITCSSSEMSAKGEHGMNIYLDKVPTRQANMQPFEILLSESQERMLLVVKAGMEEEVLDVFEKWDLSCVCIGEVVEGNAITYYQNGAVVAQVKAYDLVLGGGAPVYNREYEEPQYFEALKKFDINTIDDLASSNLQNTLEQMVAIPNIASKKWVSEQYDSMVGIANASVNKPSDAAIIRTGVGNKAVACTVDCNSRHVYADPYKGTMMAVSEAARNIVCSGGAPLAITNCLNFGNPYKKNVYWQFVNAIKGMGDACIKFNTPVTGGNVSFYNQSDDDGPVFPTPTIGMVGLIDNIEDAMTLDFKAENDIIYMLGVPQNEISSSQYLLILHNDQSSSAPYFNLEEEHHMQSVLSQVISSKLIQSAHDISDGGLGITLLESAFVRDLGFSIHTDENFRTDAYLFGEAGGRVIVSVSPNKQRQFEQSMAQMKLYHSKLGHVTSDEIIINDNKIGSSCHYKHLYDNSLASKMNQV